MEMTGARMLLECLKREGVDLVFGYPGGYIINVFHELPNHPEIRHILCRHEQGAVHEADGYARATGKVGVCMVTSGPGATNTVTGLATANADSIPLVVISGQVNSHLIGNDAFQEVDIVGITRSCTKHNFLCQDLSKFPTVIRQAFHLARSGRPGPVLVDLPKDLQISTAEFVWPEEVRMRSYNPTYRPNLNQIRIACDLLTKARQPLILTGGGVISSNASDLLRKLAHDYSIPVCSTLMGLGGFPGNDPLFLGLLGMHGTYVSNRAVSNADLLITIGSRFSDRVTGRLSQFAPKAKIVHIDIDPTSIRKNVEVEVPVVGDCRQALSGMLEVLAARKYDVEPDWKRDHAPWLSQLDDWRKSQPLSFTKGANLKPQQVLQALEKLAPEDAIFVTEVGQHQMWAAQFLTIKEPRTFISSGGMGTMGYGLPAAIGAQLGKPGNLVVDIAGDGSIQMNIQELQVAVSNRLPVKVLILNNAYLGMVRQWQELFFERNYSFTDMSEQPDFVKLAEAYGAEGYRISTEAELEELLPKALRSPNPAIIDARVEREENVYPMVPSGAALDDMLLV